MDLHQILGIFSLKNILFCVIILLCGFHKFGNACQLTITPKLLQVKEGENVTFRCVSAPCPYEVDITWTLDGIVVTSLVKHLSYVNTYFVTNSSWYFESLDIKYNNSQLWCNSTDDSDVVDIVVIETDNSAYSTTTESAIADEGQGQSPEVVFLAVAAVLFVLAVICLGVAAILFVRIKGCSCCNEQVTEVRRRITVTLRGKKTLSNIPLSKNTRLEVPKTSTGKNIKLDDKKGVTNKSFTDVDREYSYADDPTKHYYLDLVDDSDTKSKDGNIYEDVEETGDDGINVSRS